MLMYEDWVPFMINGIKIGYLLVLKINGMKIMYLLVQNQTVYPLMWLLRLDTFINKLMNHLELCIAKSLLLALC